MVTNLFPVSYKIIVHSFRPSLISLAAGSLCRHLADVCLGLLAGDVIPLPVRSDPGTVLVIIPIVRLVVLPVSEAHTSSIHPGESSFIQEVSQSNPSSRRSSEGVDSVLLSLGLNGGESGSFCNTAGDCIQIACWAC